MRIPKTGTNWPPSSNRAPRPLPSPALAIAVHKIGTPNQQSWQLQIQTQTQTKDQVKVVVTQCQAHTTSIKKKFWIFFSFLCSLLPRPPKVDGGYVFTLFVGLCLWAKYLKKLWTDSYEIWCTGWECEKYKLIRFFGEDPDPAYQWDTKRKLFSLMEVHTPPSAVLAASYVLAFGKIWGTTFHYKLERALVRVRIPPSRNTWSMRTYRAQYIFGISY